MKKISFIIIVLILVHCFSDAQITISSADLPSANDTFRVSIGDITQPNIDFTTTGANATWDFSNLTAINQTIDSFVTVASTGATYSLIYIDLAINPSRANMAMPTANFAGLPPGIPISDIFNFYYKSSSQFRSPGFGIGLNGTGIPITYNNKDIIYHLPINFNDADSCDADITLNLTGLGYYGDNQHRVNAVDGWGTLITPYGTFDALRVKSIITAHDSIHLDTLGGFDFAFDRNSIEYKWLGAGQGIPLLEIQTTMNLAVETITAIRFRDSIRPVFLSVNEIPRELEHVNVFPNPVNENSVVTFELKNAALIQLEMIDATGKKVCTFIEKQLNAGVQNILIQPSKYHLSKGIYTLILQVDGQRYAKKFVVIAQ